MPAERFFAKGELSEGAELFLDGTEFHHFAHVMRGNAGDRIELVNGMGYLAEAEVKALEKKKGARLLINSVKYENPPVRQITLMQAVPRPNRLDFILEKGTELGMTEIILFPGERSERKSFTESQLERMEAQIIAALKQCGRLWLPKLTFGESIEKWKKGDYKLFFGDVDPAAPLLKAQVNAANCAFVVGPESGFTDKETTQLKNLGAIGVSLNTHILRTDTAALAALAILCH